MLSSTVAQMAVDGHTISIGTHGGPCIQDVPALQGCDLFVLPRTFFSQCLFDLLIRIERLRPTFNLRRYALVVLSIRRVSEIEPLASTTTRHSLPVRKGLLHVHVNKTDAQHIRIILQFLLVCSNPPSPMTVLAAFFCIH